MRYDCIIIGTGPAGLEAALNLKIRRKSFLIFGNADLSRKIRLAPRVQNYLGLPAASGEELARAFSQHLADMHIEITTERVSLAYPMGEYFAIATQNNTYEASAIILAPGVSSSAELEGERKFLGRGVGYCATCDAPLYKGKNVVIVGYPPDSVHEAEFVAELAAKVYFVPVGDFKQLPKPPVEIIKQKPIAILGESRVSGIKLSEQVIDADGVFILREATPPDSLVPGIELESGFIKVDAKMQTNIKGCFAAGDCTGKPHQYIRAAGQGLVAAHSAVEYIDKQGRR